jgi:hypothetical protein
MQCECISIAVSDETILGRGASLVGFYKHGKLSKVGLRCASGPHGSDGMRRHMYVPGLDIHVHRMPENIPELKVLVCY